MSIERRILDLANRREQARQGGGEKRIERRPADLAPDRFEPRLRLRVRVDEALRELLRPSRRAARGRRLEVVSLADVVHDQPRRDRRQNQERELENPVRPANQDAPSRTSR